VDFFNNKITIEIKEDLNIDFKKLFKKYIEINKEVIDEETNNKIEKIFNKYIKNI
jgi:hypothetical protein